MKILLVSGIYPPDVGGPATFIPQLTKALIAKNHFCKVLTLSDHKISKEDKEIFSVIRVPRNTIFSFRFILIIVIIAFHILRGYKVFANGLHEECGIALFLTGGKGVAKIVGDPIWERASNNLSTKLNLQEFSSEKLELKYRIQRKLLVFSLNNFQVIITPSIELKELTKHWQVRKIILHIPNGVPVKKQEKNTKNYDVITVSRLVPWKNVEILVDAANKYGFSLCIIGDGPDFQKIKDKASGNNRIFMTGKLAQDQVDTLLSKSRIFALISNYEGLSFALLQAMSFGLPVLVSNAPGNSYVVNKSRNGVIVENLSITKVGDEITKLLYNSEKLAEYSINSLNSVENNFDLDICLEKTIEILES